MKAQSAIEYLITYGWMLVVVSIVSGAAYSTIGSQCVESTSGFTGRGLQITDFGTSGSSNDIDLLLENRKSDNVEIKKVKFDYNNEARELSLNEDIQSYEAVSVGIPGFKQSDSCNSIDVELVYDTGTLKDQKASGQITANIELDDTIAPLSPGSFNAGYPNL